MCDFCDLRDWSVEADRGPIDDDFSTHVELKPPPRGDEPVEQKRKRLKWASRCPLFSLPPFLSCCLFEIDIQQEDIWHVAPLKKF